MKNFNSISILAFFIVLHVARNAVPYAVYPLIVLLFPFTLYQFVNVKEAKQAIVKSVKVFSPIILLIIIELVAIFCTAYPFRGLPLDFLKEFCFISIFLFLLSRHIQNKQDFKQLIRHIGNYFILFSVIISILGLWKFFYSPSFISFHYLNENFHLKWGTTIVSDYNFFALFLLNGLVLGLHKLLCSPNKIKYKVLFLIALQVIISATILSGSRRLTLCLTAFFMVNLLLLIPFIFNKLFSNIRSYKYLCLFLFLSIAHLGVIYSFLSYFPLVSEKAEKTFFIDRKNIDNNILQISTRINSAVSYYLIDIHKKEEMLAKLEKEKVLAKLGKEKNISSVSSETEETENIVLPTVILEIDETKEVISLTSSRQELWHLGKKIYHEYTIPQKIFGRGFTFLYVSQKETGHCFYPHYLFLSILLFSGIIGLVLYVTFLVCISLIYLFYFKDLGVLFLLFLLNFTFGFFSFTDFFGATFYAILLILPLLYAYLHGYKELFNRICSYRIKKND